MKIFFNLIPYKITGKNTSSTQQQPAFGSKSDAALLMKFADKFNCAYSGNPMLLKEALQEILSKLVNKQSASEALEVLLNYSKYIYNSAVLNLLTKANSKNKKDFRDILQENFVTSIERLRMKERNVIESTNNILEMLSPEAKKSVELIKEESMDKISDDTFARNFPLKMIKSLTGNEQDISIFTKIYRAWYQLPRSSKDIDAFIVKYSRQAQDAIAKRLISPAEASIEHIKPASDGGNDELNNYLLVCNQLNSERNSMPLDEYAMLNPALDIPKHLQEYTNAVINEINNGTSCLSNKIKYPDAIQKAVLQESSGYIVLDTSGLIYGKNSQLT